MMMIQCVFTNKSKSRLTDIKNKLIVTKGESGGGQGDKLGVLFVNTHCIIIILFFLKIHWLPFYCLQD